MAITIGTLTTGSFTINTNGGGGGSSKDPTKTRIWWSNSESDYTDYSFSGEITGTMLLQAGLIDENAWESDGMANWNNQPTKIEFGSPVTGIGNRIFSYTQNSFVEAIGVDDNITSIGEWTFYNANLTSLTIGSKVSSIELEAFFDCYSLTSLVFQGRTLAQVRGMNNYPWGISDESIISVA